jgi:glycosyltransferase involved in cell wall biosynthesis
MESNYSGDDSSVISIPQTYNLSGYFLACIRRLRYCLVTPYDLLLIHKFLPVNTPCIIAAKLRGKKTLVDWDDLDCAYQPTVFRKAITRWTERWMPRFADVVTTHNQRIKERAWEVGARKVITVSQAVDTSIFDPARYDRDRIRARLGLQDKKVISYVCSLDWGGSRDLDKVLAAIKLVEQKRSDIILLIIGGGILQEQFQKMAADLKIKKVSFTGSLSQESVAGYLAASDLALIYMRDDLGNQMRFSLKLLEYLCMGKTVVGHLVGATKYALDEYCVLTTGRIEDFADTIMKALDAPPGAKDARKHIVKHYDWQVVKQSIQAALSELDT